MNKIDIKHIAKLARIRLSPEEEAAIQPELEAILGFVEQLQAVDVDDLVPTFQVTGLVDVMREDVVKPSMDRELLLSNTPNQQDGYIKVQRVL